MSIDLGCILYSYVAKILTFHDTGKLSTSASGTRYVK